MDWLSNLISALPIPRVQVSSERKSLVLRHKISVVDLEVCTPKGILRERPLWQKDRLDFYHLRSDGSIEHTPGD